MTWTHGDLQIKLFDKWQHYHDVFNTCNVSCIMIAFHLQRVLRDYGVFMSHFDHQNPSNMGSLSSGCFLRQHFLSYLLKNLFPCFITHLQMQITHGKQTLAQKSHIPPCFMQILCLWINSIPRGKRKCVWEQGTLVIGKEGLN